MLFLIEVIKGILMFAAVCVGLGIVYLVFIIAREVGWVVKQESRKQYRAKQKQCGFCDRQEVILQLLCRVDVLSMDCISE